MGIEHVQVIFLLWLSFFLSHFRHNDLEHLVFLHSTFYFLFFSSRPFGTLFGPRCRSSYHYLQGALQRYCTVRLQRAHSDSAARTAEEAHATTVPKTAESYPHWTQLH